MESRFKNSIRNSFWGVLTNLVMTLLNFLVRTIFIKTLSNEYLGINGLFTNILYILSFAELGVGHAITYCMYKPAAVNDHEKLKSLLKLYKKYYNIIGIIIIFLGIIVIPFLPYIIKEVPDIKENIIFIYLIYLIETASSYFFIYKKSIITVYQKEYIYNVVKLIIQIIKSIIQIIVLLTTKNYVLYLVVFVLSTILTNIITNISVNKLYPFIKERKVKSLSKEEEKGITKNIKSLILYKFGRVALSGTDNIIISAVVGITAVGLYSNYSLIISAVSGIVYLLLNGTNSSIGNVNATESIEKKELLMKRMLFVSSWLYGFITICLAILLKPFIMVWIGEEYTISYLAALSAVFYILIDGLEYPSHTYISTLGYFKETRYISLLCALINIILSVILGKYYGLFGVFISTSISKILTTSWFDTYTIYRKEFNKSPKSYYLKHVFLLVIIVINYLICQSVANLLPDGTIGLFALKTIITAGLSNLIFLLIFYKTEDFKYVYNKIRRKE